LAVVAAADAAADDTLMVAIAKLFVTLSLSQRAALITQRYV